MARKAETPEEKIVLTETETGNEPEVQETPVEVVEEETPIEVKVKKTTVPSAVKKVKIHVREEVDSWVGGEHYILRANKDYQVPEDVAAILTNSQKAYRI